MTAIKIASIKLDNFRGAQGLFIEPPAAGLDFLGPTGSGKTTIADAVRWVFADEDTSGRKPSAKGFDILRLVDGEPTGAAADVEIAADVNGERRTFRKLYRQVTTKRHGDGPAEVTGHTTDQWVDGVPTKAGDYAAAVADAFGIQPDEYRMLSDPLFFASRLTWQQRRKVLLDIVGGVSRDDIIEREPELRGLCDEMGRRSVEDFRKVIGSGIRGVNPRLKEIHAAIAERGCDLKDLGASDEKTVQRELVRLRGLRTAAEAERQRIEHGGELGKARADLASARSEIQQYETAAAAERDHQAAAIRRRIGELGDTEHVAGVEVRRVQADLATATEEVREIAEAIERYQSERRRLNEAPGWEPPEGDNICGECGQQIPAAKIEATRARAREAFNTGRASEIQGLDAMIAEREKVLATWQRTAEDLERRLEKAEAELAAAATDVGTAKETLDRTLAELPRIDDAPIQRERDLKRRIAELEAGAGQALEEVGDRIAELDLGIQAQEHLLADHERQRQARERIDELKGEEKELAVAFEALERKLSLCDLYSRARVEVLKDREGKLAAVFRLARFRLFREHVGSDRLEDRCDVTTTDGRPWDTSMSSGERIRIGCDIVRGLQDHFGVELPVWVDDAVLLTDDLDLGDAQMFRLLTRLPRGASPEAPPIGASKTGLRWHAAKGEG